MPIISSFGALRSMSNPQAQWSAAGSQPSALHLYGLSQQYFEIYKTQPNVRICVDFLARNIAHVGLLTYRRVSDTDRERLIDHDLARWLGYPNPATTTYRLIEDLMTDLGIYFRAYWAKVRYRDLDGRAAIGLVRLPPEQMRVEGGLLPDEFIWTVDGKEKRFPPSEIVHFSGYRLGISPLETLRRILAEEHAAGGYRESLWSHGAKHEGIWERDKDSPKYDKKQLEDWRDQWQQFASSSKAGMTAVGERGWTYKQTSFSSKDSEYIAGGKLRREICAAAYHIPQPMVGILDHATFSNIKEQHKHTYQDTLGPWMENIQQEIERQLLPECDERDGVYVEFNIAAKLAGSFEEQATSLQALVGRPVMKVNEGRARLNLPRDTDPESDKVAPQQGGPASNTRPAPAVEGDEDAAVAAVVHSTRQRQQARLSKLEPGERAAEFQSKRARWDGELAIDLWPLIGDRSVDVAHAANTQLLKQLQDEADE